MGFLRLQFVVSFSSQDTIHTADNLLKNSSGSTISSKRWLCSSCDKSGKLEGEFQLEQASLINFIDIGNYGSATVEVQVGRSSWPRNREYVTLLPAVTLMTLSDSKSGINKTSVRMFTKEHLNKEAIGEKWDRVRVICCQPYVKNSQFGLCFLRVGNKEEKLSEKHVLVVENASKTKVPSTGIKNEDRTFSEKCSSHISRKAIFGQSMQSFKKSDGLEPASKIQCISPNSSRSKLTSYLSAKSKGNSPKTGPVLKKQSWPFQQEATKFLSLQSYPFDESDSEVLLGAMEKWRHKALTCEEKIVFRNVLQQICGNQNGKTLTRKRMQGSKELYRNASHTDKPEAMTRQLSSVHVMSGHNRKNASPAQVKPRTKIEEHNQLKMPVFDLTWSDDDELDFISLKPLSSLSALPHLDKSANYSVHGENQSDMSLGSPSTPSLESEQFNMSFSECPICSELFSSNSIESHASECGVLRPPESFLTHESSGMVENVLTDCPICGDFFETNSIALHADQCAERMKS